MNCNKITSKNNNNKLKYSEYLIDGASGGNIRCANIDN